MQGNRIIIVGAGGFGREVALYLSESHPNTPLAGFIDDNPAAMEGHDQTVPFLGSIAAFTPAADDLVVIAVGAPSLRRKLASTLSARGARFLSLLHPRALVAPNAVLGTGVIVGPFAYVGPEAQLGDHVVLNVYASAGHDTKVGDFTVLSPYVTLHGHSIIEDEVFLGGHSFVTGGRRVHARAKVAAGAAVYSDVPEGRLALGNPAKLMAVPKDE